MKAKVDKEKLQRAMKAGAHEARVAAGDVVDQLRPRNALRDLHELVTKFGNDEGFREYLVARIWIAVPVLFVFVLVSTVCAIGIMFFTARLVAPPVPVSLRFLALLLGAVIWAGGIAAQACVFLLWLEERAAQRARAARGAPAAIPPGVLAYLKYSRAALPWIVILVCVVIPLAVLAVYAPLMAAILVVLAVLAPVAFDKLDR